MITKKLFQSSLLLIIFMAFIASLSAKEVIRINVALIPQEKHYHYYFELLKESLNQLGYECELTVTEDVPQVRVAQMLDDGSADLYYFLESEERNLRWMPVEEGLTDNLIGQRILFIPKGCQYLYGKVKNLSDFRNLNKIGVMGKNWYDVKVWSKNHLKYQELEGDWQGAYLMVASQKRQVDYFSRGFNEIVVEAKEHPELDVEKNLMLVYNRDYRFYLNKQFGSKYQKLLSSAIRKAKESGLMDRLIKKHWAENFEILNYDKRIKIRLENP